MGIFDSAREQAEKLMAEHGDKLEQPSDQALDRMAAEASRRTGGRFDEHVDSARDLADAHIGTDDAMTAPPAAGGASAVDPDATDAVVTDPADPAYRPPTV